MKSLLNHIITILALLAQSLAKDGLGRWIPTYRVIACAACAGEVGFIVAACIADVALTYVLFPRCFLLLLLLLLSSTQFKKEHNNLRGDLQPRNPRRARMRNLMGRMGDSCATVLQSLLPASCCDHFRRKSAMG